MKKIAIGIIAASAILLTGCTQTTKTTTQQVQPVATPVAKSNMESTKSGESTMTKPEKTDAPTSSFKPTTDADIKAIDKSFDAVTTTDLNDKDLQGLSS